MFCNNFLTENNILFEVESIESEEFTQKLIAFATEIQADLIAIVNSSEGSFLGSAESQYIIANEANIPVLCVNSAITYSGGMMFS